MQAAQKTNDAAGDGTTTATVLSAALIAEGMKVVAAGANPVQVTRGMARTVARLVEELKGLSQVLFLFCCLSFVFWTLACINARLPSDVVACICVCRAFCCRLHVNKDLF